MTYQIRLLLQSKFLKKILEKQQNIKIEKNDNINCNDCKISKLKKKPFNKNNQ